MTAVREGARGDIEKVCSVLASKQRMLLRCEIACSSTALDIGDNLSILRDIQNSILLTEAAALRILVPSKSQGRESTDSHG
jgi:hypothetical protein